MAQPARFTFDLDLANQPAPEPILPTVPENLVAQLMAQAREEAYAEGIAAGERNATAHSAQTMATAATALAARTAEMIATLDDTNAANLRDIATGHMSSSGFAGRLVVLGDPDIRLGDGRLEWVEGGLVRDINAISKQIDSKIKAYLAARSGQSQEDKHP
jgi:flagellar assembly protein FliH